MAPGRIQITPMQTKLTHFTMLCSRCGEGQSVAWAYPVDFYEQHTWAGSRLVCQACADALSSGESWQLSTPRRKPDSVKAAGDAADVKGQIELATIDLFLRQYNALTGRDFRLVQKQERPDALLEASDGSQLGVEVTIAGYPYFEGEHSSGADNEIAFLLGRVPGDHSEGQTFSRLIDEVNRRLAEKARTYASVRHDYPIVLVVRSASPLWSARNFELSHADIVVPPSSFSEIWLLTLADDGSGWTHLMELSQDPARSARPG